MGNCECSKEGARSQDAEEPSSVVASNDSAFVVKSAPAAEDVCMKQEPVLEDGEAPGDVAEANGPAEDTESAEGSDVLRKAADSDSALKKISMRFASNEMGAGLLVDQANDEEVTFQRQLSVNSAAYALHPGKERLTKLASQRGFFIALDDSLKQAVHKNGTKDPMESHPGTSEAPSDALLRVTTNPSIEDSKILGVFIPHGMLDRRVEEKTLVQYFETQRGIIPFLNLKNGLLPLNKGVQLVEVPESLDDLLQAARDSGVRGVKINSIVKQPNLEGIAALVEQQFDLAKRIMKLDLLPVLHIGVDIRVSTKSNVSRQDVLASRRKSEEMLFDKLLSALGDLQGDQQVMFSLSLPAKPNIYLSLVGHPNTVRVMLCPEGYKLKTACEVLERNFGLVGDFGGDLIMEGTSPDQNEVDFTSTLQENVQKTYAASIAVPTKEMQTTKVSVSPGFFACLDFTAKRLDQQMARYRLGSRSDYTGDAEALARVHEMRCRILENNKFSGSRVVGLMINEDTMEREIRNKPTAKYLWEEKQIVPFLSLDYGLSPDKDGVQIVKDIPKLDRVLSKAVNAGIYGIKICSMVKAPNREGITAAISKTISLSLKIMEKELVPVMHFEVDLEARKTSACEDLIFEILGSSLAQFRPEQKVILWLSPPTKANRYLPLKGHPSVIRIVFASGGRDRAKACKMLQDNFETIGGFNRAFVEGMHWEQTDGELTSMIDSSCQAIFESSRSPSAKTLQAYIVAKQEGFFLALSNLASITKFSVVTNPQFTSIHVIGVTLTHDQLELQASATPLAKYIWETKRMVPFMHLDVEGLLEISNGVQLIREIGDDMRASLLAKAVRAGIFGITAQSKIHSQDSRGIHDVVQQQFRWAKDVLAKGLVPLIKIFVEQNDPVEKEKCERTLRLVVGKALRSLDQHDTVILNFVLPSVAGFYDCFATHPNVLRVLGTPGLYKFDTSLLMLSQNPKLIGSFGRILLAKLESRQSTYAEFSEAVGQACRTVCQASVTSGDRSRRMVRRASLTSSRRNSF